MASYIHARMQTKRKIEMAFWELYLEKSFRRVTVGEITDRAGIHRSTFYTYFDSVDCVFDAIKSQQLQLLKDVLSIKDSVANEYRDFLSAFRQLYDENKVFLKPLLVDYHSSAFSREYRHFMIDQLRQDVGLPLYPEDSEAYEVIDMTIAGFIEMFIRALDADQIDMQTHWRMIHYMMENGTKPALLTYYNIPSEERPGRQ